MIDIFVSPDEVQVAGGPSNVEVDLDFGATGQRGSRILVGPGKPGPFTIPEGVDILEYDIYINILETDDEYSFLYQYTTAGTPGVFEWIKIFRVAPQVPSVIAYVVFVDGVGEFAAPLADYFDPDYIPFIIPEILSITYGVENANPLASAISDIRVVDGEIFVDFTAAEFSSGTWSNFSGLCKVNMLIAATSNIDIS
jgi:hypothetical protein